MSRFSKLSAVLLLVAASLVGCAGNVSDDGGTGDDPGAGLEPISADGYDGGAGVDIGPTGNGCAIRGPVDAQALLGPSHVIAVFPFTGELANSGEIQLMAAQWARDALLEGAGIRPGQSDALELYPVNSGNSKEEVQETVLGFIQERQAAGEPVVGVISSGTYGYEGSLKPALAAGIPHFEVSAPIEDEWFLSGGDRSEVADTVSLAFSTRPSAWMRVQLAAEFIQRSYPGQTLALLSGSQPYDMNEALKVRDELMFYATLLPAEEAIVAIENTEFAYPIGFDVGFGSIETLVTDASPDLLYLSARSAAENLNALIAVEHAGFSGDLFISGQLRSPSLVDNAAVNNLLSYLADRVHLAMATPIPSDDLLKWKQAYSIHFTDLGLGSDTYAPGAFDAMMLLGLGYIRAGGEGGTAARDAITAIATPPGRVVGFDVDVTTGCADVSALVEAAEAGEDIDYQGASSSIDFIEGVQGELGDPKWIPPAAYYMEVIRGDEDGDDIGSFEILVDWDPLYDGGDVYWRTAYRREDVAF